jgi:inorganic pyrophosphatase
MPNRSIRSALFPILLALGCAGGDGGFPIASGLKADGPHSYSSKRNLLTNYMPRNQDGTLNVVVEIPAGTSEKWEVNEDGSALVRDFTGDTPRVIDYLPYPGNYGLIPRTLLDAERGGDGGALDVMVIGPSVPRGTVVRARPIGIVRVVDRMEQDDKILAVMAGPTLKEVYDIESLEARYPGASQIISIWWSNAHGKRSKVNLMGTGSRGQANAVIDYAAESWKEKKRKERDAAR